MKKNLRFGLGLILVLIFLLVTVLLMKPRGPKVLAQVKVADNRIFQVEAVTYGTNHVCGESTFLLDHFGFWLPAKIHKLFEPEQPRSEISVDKPSLVIWVNALNPTNGNFIDCQSVRLQLEDENGDLFGNANPHWFGGSKFWRVGHVFEAYPRNAKELKLQIVPYRKAEISVTTIPNPRVVQPEKWSGQPTPLKEKFQAMELELTRLTKRTNGSPKSRWETPTQYWEPEWTFLRNGKPADGWDEPNWTAEDPLGNRGQFLGIHQPVLRIRATVYPSATNLNDALLLTTLPSIEITNTATNWWNIRTKSGSNEIVTLGLFPAGSYTFLEGNMVTNPPRPMGPVRGGAPSGWTGMNERVSPMQVKEWHGHYTDKPVLYVRATSLAAEHRLGIRLRDEQGNYWLAKPEPQGHPDNIYAFMLKLPDTIKTVVPELVEMKPVEAKFLVKTPAAVAP